MVLQKVQKLESAKCERKSAHRRQCLALETARKRETRLSQCQALVISETVDEQEMHLSQCCTHVASESVNEHDTHLSTLYSSQSCTFWLSGYAGPEEELIK